MKIEQIKQVKIELEGEEIKQLKKALEKISEGVKRVGFNSINLTDEESELIKKVSNEL